MLNEVPEGWQRQRLTECFDVKSSKRVLQKQWRKQGIPFYRGREITALSEHGSVDNELFIDEELYRTFAEKSGVPSKGDILITAIGTIGNTYCVKESEEFYFKDASVLWLSKKADVNSLFINYWLNSASFKNQLDSGNGTTVDSLTIKQLSNSYLLIPPLTEQKRIAEVLSSVDKSIQATQRLIKQAERVKQGLMEELLTGGLGSEAIERGEVPEGWQSLTAKDLAEPKGLQTGPFGSQLKANEHIDVEEQGACRVIMPKNIKNGQIDFESASIITAEKANDLDKHTLEVGDVLFARRGDLSKVAIYYGVEKAICGTGCLRLRPKKELVNAHFLRFLFTNHKAIDWLHANAVGATMLNLNTQIIGNLPVLLPPIKQQEEISGALMALEDFCLQHEVRLSSFAKLKNGLMDDLLTGKVRTV
ncbi:hypothetical protein CWE13_07375 [Aliidiomarina shirensis]|uniref:Type I restriction modification DNA specificity domain-containing protein n=1 Tax=Aliidiomarina shirensis TaxID=1048642 RepID=A0A432WVI5_9GAMM|nr:restriction endonuclease subunit S [Aliidiomarina shirensis]RUO37757.1 hypothetical protein CWE13_07375 [Aliidiomarina shirensis]